MTDTQRQAGLAGLAGRLISERRRLQLTRAQLAAAVGSSGASQTGYEQGDRYPPTDYMCQLRGLGVDVLYVMFGESSQDFVADNLDWELLGRIVAAITRWCQSSGSDLKPEKFGKVFRLLYEEHRRRPDAQEMEVGSILELVT